MNAKRIALLYEAAARARRHFVGLTDAYVVVGRGEVPGQSFE